MRSWWTATRIGLAGSSGTAVLAGIETAGLVEGSGLVALAVAVATAGFTGRRIYLDHQPLRLSATALKGELMGHPVMRFRACLGQGRLVTERDVHVRWLPEEGEAIELAWEDPGTGHTIGPWTITIVDRARELTAPGRVEVVVEASEPGRSWSAERSWRLDELGTGRFGGALTVESGRLRYDPRRWDAIVCDPEPA